MKKKYLAGISVAVIAIAFTVFVAANNASDKSGTKAVKTAATSQSAASNNKTAETPAATATDTTADTPTSVDTSTPADQKAAKNSKAASVLAVVTKSDSSNGSSTVSTTNPTTTNSGSTGTTTVAPVTPAPVTPAPVTPAPAPAPASSNLVANPSVETANGAAPASWTYGGFGTNSATSSYDQTSGHTGTSSLNVAITAYTDGDAKWVSDPIAVTAGQTYQVGDFYKSVGTSEVDVAYNAGATTTYGQVGAAAASADWVAFNGQFTVPAGVTSVQIFHSLTSVGNLSTDDYSVTTGAATTPTPAPVPVTPAPGTGFTGGRVSLTFDDGLTSTYVNGGPLLKKYNFVSTQYLISDTLEHNGDYGSDYMTVDQAKALIAQVPGTEAAGHTEYHCDLTNQQSDNPDTTCPLGLTAEQLATKNAAELTESKAYLESIFGAGSITDFASPYGAYNDAAIAEIKAAGFASHRSTDDGFNTYGAFDPYNIHVQNVEAGTTVAQVEAWVNQAISTNTWLVLVYHDVDTTAAGSYGVTTADLDTELGYIQTTGVKVETVASALAGN